MTQTDTRFPMAIFVHGGAELVDDIPVTSRVVHTPDELEAAQADGWHDSAAAALAQHEAQLAAEEAERQAAADAAAAAALAQGDGKPPTREELEQKATELGIEFKPQTSNKKIAEAIAAKLADKPADPAQ